MSHGQTMKQRLSKLRACCAKNETLLENLGEVCIELRELDIVTDLGVALEKKVSIIAYNRRRYYEDLKHEHEKSLRPKDPRQKPWGSARWRKMKEKENVVHQARENHGTTACDEMVSGTQIKTTPHWSRTDCKKCRCSGWCPPKWRWKGRKKEAALARGKHA